MSAVDQLSQGREAFGHRSWAAAFECLSAVDPAEISVEDLSSLATAAYLIGNREASVRALQRAYRIHSDAGATLAAVRDALWIAFVFNNNGNPAVGGGWVARGRRLLETAPADCVEHGYLMLHDMFRHIFAGEYGAAMGLASEIHRVGEQHRDSDLVATALSCQGRLLIYSGRVPEGLALLDEAMVGLAAGEVSPLISGHVYCLMIEACQEIADFRRMADWTAALTDWCDGQPDLVPFTGQCAIHRAQILRAESSYEQALAELVLSVERYRANGWGDAIGLAMHERGEVLRIRGEYDAAAVAFDEAAAMGRDPQPGLARLWLARGRMATAVGAIRRLLEETPDPVHRSQFLSAAVEILLAAGEVDEARAAADELAEIAQAFGCEALRAGAAFAAGVVCLAEGDAKGALPPLRSAWKGWIDVGARYEAALARCQIGLAFRAMGDEDSAVSELSVSCRTFDEIGAVPAAEEARRLLLRELPDGLTAREVEVLRLVAAGISNPQIAAELFLSEKTVARHLSNIFGKIDVPTRTAAAAYAFEHRLV